MLGKKLLTAIQIACIGCLCHFASRKFRQRCISSLLASCLQYTANIVVYNVGIVPGKMTDLSQALCYILTSKLCRVYIKNFFSDF